MAYAAQNKILPVVLSGGSGTRLWPLSRVSHPKQFISITDSQIPIIQETIARVTNSELFYPPLMVGNHEHRFLLADKMRRCGIASPDIIVEPCARNTGPAITVAALHVQERYDDTLILMMPTDHIILNVPAFIESVKRAAEIASQGRIVTFGVTPTHPETGYGYIRRGQATDASSTAYDVAEFVEKPDIDKAKTFLASGDYYWSSGIHLIPSSLILDEMRQHQPELIDACKDALAASVKDHNFVYLNEASFGRAPSLSFEYAVMEHTTNTVVMPIDCGWSDTGAWDLLWQLAAKDKRGNAALGECYMLDTSDSYVRSEGGPAIVTLGVSDLIVIATKDAVFVATKDNAQSLKSAVDLLKIHNPSLVNEGCSTYRPWGMFENLNKGLRYQVKRICVKPGEKRAMQMHYHRAEHWIVVSGTAKITCDGKDSVLGENQSIYIPYGSAHRIENPGKIDLEIIEVESGAYFGDDDTIRLDDPNGQPGLH